MAACLSALNLRGYCDNGLKFIVKLIEGGEELTHGARRMTAIFIPEGNLFRATEHAGRPWSPDMLQGSATTALMVREVERLAAKPGFAVRRLAGRAGGGLLQWRGTD